MSRYICTYIGGELYTLLHYTPHTAAVSQSPFPKLNILLSAKRRRYAVYASPLLCIHCRSGVRCLKGFTRYSDYFPLGTRRGGVYTLLFDGRGCGVAMGGRRVVKGPVCARTVWISHPTQRRRMSSSQHRKSLEFVGLLLPFPGNFNNIYTL